MTTNFLLEALSQAEGALLAPYLQSVELRKGTVLLTPGQDVEHVWFPVSGLVSVISVLSNGQQIESSIFGRESAIGFIEASGGGVSHSLIAVHGHGAAVKLPAARYRDAFDRSAALRKAVGQHIELLLTEARQEIACRACHAAPGRLSRWLLQCRDKAGADNLEMTQDLLAIMVGTDRTTISTIAARMRRAGVVRYARGRITLLDKPRLEATACECYRTMKHFRGLMGQPGS